MKNHPFTVILGIGTLIYVLWIFVATSPQARIDRGCEPVNWMGNLSVSVTALIYSPYETSVDHAFKRMDYGCQYALWRLFYEKEWEAYQAAQKKQAAAAAAAGQRAAEQDGAQ